MNRLHAKASATATTTNPMMGTNGGCPRMRSVKLRSVVDTDEQRAAGILGRLPPSLRALTITLVRQLAPRLIKVRRPSDLRKLARDPALIRALARDFLPVIDGVIR